MLSSMAWCHLQGRSVDAQHLLLSSQGSCGCPHLLLSQELRGTAGFLQAACAAHGLSITLLFADELCIASLSACSRAAVGIAQCVEEKKGD